MSDQTRPQVGMYGDNRDRMSLGSGASQSEGQRDLNIGNR